MGSGRHATLLLVLILAYFIASSASQDVTTLPSTTKHQTLNKTDTGKEISESDTTVSDPENVSENVTATLTQVVTEKPVLNTSLLPTDSSKSVSSSPVSSSNSSISPSHSINSTGTPIQTSIFSTPSKDLHVNETTKEVTENRQETTDITNDISSAHEAGTSFTGMDNTVSTVAPKFYPAAAVDWMDVFLRTHHLEGQYYYDGRKYLFDFVARNIHPLSSRTLVAFFHDEDGAILEMNGTSSDGHQIKFVLDKVYTAGYRFPLGMQFELVGTLIASIEVTSYDGNITKPFNSSFQTFHMNKGLGAAETGDAAGTRTAIIVVIPISIAFLGIIGTVTVLCWASKKGLLRGRHRAYQLFQDTPVTFESEAETIHI